MAEILNIAQIESPKRKPLRADFIHRIKFVAIPFSRTGNPYFSFPSAMAFIRNAIFLARVRMVCMPSSSRTASPGVPPWTEFQYWLEATGMPLMVNYLLSWSKVAEQPPRLATATDAPTFMRLSKWALKKSRSSTAVRVALAEA